MGCLLLSALIYCPRPDYSLLAMKVFSSRGSKVTSLLCGKPLIKKFKLVSVHLENVVDNERV